MHKTSENNIRGPVWYPSCLPDSMPDAKCVGSFAVWRVLFQSFLEYFSKLCLVEATHKHCPLTDILLCTNLSLSTSYISCDSLQHWGESQSLHWSINHSTKYCTSVVLFLIEKYEEENKAKQWQAVIYSIMHDTVGKMSAYGYFGQLLACNHADYTVLKILIKCSPVQSNLQHNNMSCSIR